MNRPNSDHDQLMSVLAYEHPGLVERLMAKLGLTTEQATELFTKVKHFLYECTGSEAPLSPTPEVDEGWHNFILFTRDYADFCTRYFDRFLHHVPLAGATASGSCSTYCRGCSHGKCNGVLD